MPSFVRGKTHERNSTEWHWIGSAIDDGKPLADWATNSVVSHASMYGPVGIVPMRGGSTTSRVTASLGSFSLDDIIRRGNRNGSTWDDGSMHGVYVIRNPYPWTNGSDAYLIFYTGFATVDPLASRQIGVLYAPTLQGPWHAWGSPVLSKNPNASAPDSSSVSNAAPAFVRGGNGKILLAYKGLSPAQPSKPLCTDGSGKPCVFVAQAPHWSGPYSYTTANRGDVIVGEDPTLWQDERGRWHMVFEHYNGTSCGNHAFSLTGTDEWVIAPSIYSLDVELDGKKVQLEKRERPQMVFDANGTPVALANGACIGKTCFNILMGFA
eukprot:m.47404 g.47404  ORF g.47404 m.47404 type:complete len:323 (+) comp15221_c1_seq1:663-1631(+)